MIDFPNKLISLRKSKGLNQSQLAQLIGTSKQVISKYETGLRYPSLENLIKIAKCFNVTSDYLLGIDSSTNKIINVENLSNKQINILLETISEFENNSL